MKAKTQKPKAAGRQKPLDPDEVERAVAEAEKVNQEVLEFLQAVDRYKRRKNKTFPSWSEILEIIKSLGYRKVEE